MSVIFLAGRSRRLRMAEWVAFSEMTAAEARRDSMSVPIDVPLRYATIPTRPVPSNLQGVELFRKHKIQCQTSRLVPLTAERCQVALKAAESYLDGLIRCYDEYWGSVLVLQETRVEFLGFL